MVASRLSGSPERQRWDGAIRSCRVTLDKSERMYTNHRMARDCGSIYRLEPLAFFLTWTTYGSWLPGDARGWVDDRGVIRRANKSLARISSSIMGEQPVVLTTAQRHTVEESIHEHCRFRGWMLHAVNCRTTHVHAVVSAADRSPDAVLRCIKAWCSRQLSGGACGKRRWWTKGGSMRRLYDTRAIEDVVAYVVECQDRPRR